MREPPAVGEVRARLPGLEGERARLREVILAKGLKTQGPYQLTAGGTSPYLFDLKPVLLDPEGAVLVGRLGASLVHQLGATHVGGREIGAVPIAAVIAQASWREGPPLQGFFARKQAKQHGTAKLLEGNVPQDADTVVVEDVTTTGGSSMAVVDELKRTGARVKGVVTVVDREEGAAKTFAEAGIAFRALLLLRDFPELDRLR